MSFVADVSIDMPFGASTHEALPEARSTLADYHRMGDGSGASRFVLFLWMTGCDFDDLERAMAADETIESFEAITDSGDRRLYRLRSVPFPDDGFQLSVFLRDHDVTLYEAFRDREGLHLQGLFPTQESLHALKDAVKEDGGWFRLNSVYSENSFDPRRRDLTDRQREVLRVASGRGYFETPSEATLADVAGELDISPQAVSTHLRSAVAKLVEDALDSETPSTRPHA